MRSDSPRVELTGEFPDLLEENLVLQKEVYAHFGLAFFKFALVEHSLINVLTFHFAGELLRAGTTRSTDEWIKSIDQGERQAVALTFGNLAKRVAAIEEFVELSQEISEVKKLRDYFAHHFMREEAALFGSDEGCWFALEKIAEVRRKTLKLEEGIKPRFTAMCIRLGIPTPSEEQVSSLVEGYLSEKTMSVSDGSAKMGWENESI